MFKKTKPNYKAKLEHQLYLARENPEPVFDLSDCGLNQVPNGIYSLCRVFLKEILLLDHNKLTSLSNGGVLHDLSGLKLLNLSFNSFTTLPNELDSLTSLKELYLNNNHLKSLPKSIGGLVNLHVLDVSENSLRVLPSELGDLVQLEMLNVTGNSRLTHLPYTLCKVKRLKCLRIDSTNFVYPPADVVAAGTEATMKFICYDNGVNYESPECDNSTKDSELKSVEESQSSQKQKLDEKLKFEKEYELYQRQELELQAAVRADKQKFLIDLTEQQSRLDNELSKIQQQKELERHRLIQELREEEAKSDLAISNLLTLMKEPLLQLIEQEKLEEERLLSMAARHSGDLRRNDVLNAMRSLLEDETNKFKEYDQTREESARSILAQEMMCHSHLSNVIRIQGEQQAELVSQLQQDMELQRIAVGALLERSDARSWSLIQQVHLVESQLAKLTTIEIDRQKLQVDEHLNDLAEKRVNLSALLIDLLEQQGLRRAQLLCTLQNMEEMGRSQEDFWLIQYQQLLDRRTFKLVDIQRNIDLEFAQELLLAGVIQYLPFLAEWIQTDSGIELTDEQLIDLGVKNENDRRLILLAYKNYCKLKISCKKMEEESPSVSAAAAAASAPAPALLEHTTSLSGSTECVICMDTECQMIFVPCGHMCCCIGCSTTLIECPLCRGTIERKIKVLVP